MVERKALVVDVTTDKETYSIGDWAYITVKVTYNPGVSIEDAYVQIEIVTASGRKYSSDGTTDADGLVTFRFKIKVPDGTGTYHVTAEASKSGYESGSDETSFTVE